MDGEDIEMTTERDVAEEIRRARARAAPGEDKITNLALKKLPSGTVR